MNIVILGAGTVGTSIARALCARHHNVCVVDQSKSALSEIQDRLDVHTVRGNASDPITLFQAGVASATLCLALTSSDEVNIVSASIVKVGLPLLKGNVFFRQPLHQHDVKEML